MLPSELSLVLCGLIMNRKTLVVTSFSLIFEVAFFPVEGRASSRQHLPQSFSGSCCSLHLTTQCSAQPQLASVKGPHHICVCGREQERVIDRQTDSGGSVTGFMSSVQSLQGAYRGRCVFIIKKPRIQCKLCICCVCNLCYQLYMLYTCFHSKLFSGWFFNQ